MSGPGTYELTSGMARDVATAIMSKLEEVNASNATSAAGLSDAINGSGLRGPALFSVRDTATLVGEASTADSNMYMEIAQKLITFADMSDEQEDAAAAAVAGIIV